MPTDLFFCNQCKVVKVVHGNRSDDHCNQSDTWPSTTTTALLVVLSLVPHACTHTHTHTHTHTSMHACTHACTYTHASSAFLLLLLLFILFLFCSQSTKHLADFWFFGEYKCWSLLVKYWKLLVNVNPGMGWEFSVSGPSLFSPDSKYCMFVHKLKHQCHSVVKVSTVSWHKNSQHEPDEA